MKNVDKLSLANFDNPLDLVKVIIDGYDQVGTAVAVIDDCFELLNVNKSAISILENSIFETPAKSILEIFTLLDQDNIFKLSKTSNSFSLVSTKDINQKYKFTFCTYAITNKLYWAVFIEQNSTVSIESNSLLKVILNDERNLVLVTSVGFEIIECNSKAKGVFNLDNKALEFTHGLCWIPDSHKLQIVGSILANLASANSYNSTIEIATYPGQTSLANVSIHFIKIEEFAFNLIQLEFVNSYANGEVELKVSQKRYEDLIKHNQALICTHDINGKILSLNPASLKALKYEHESELVDKSLAMLFDAKDIEAFKSYIKCIQDNGEASGVMRVVSKDGDIMYWVYKNYLVREDDFAYVVGSAQDISDRILIERELKKAKILAENALKTREQFLANVSHELRTPLHGVLGINDLLRETLSTDLQRNYSSMIEKSAKNLVFLVNDILDVAKMEAGQFTFENIAFELFHVINKSLAPLVIKIDEKRLNFELIQNVKGEVNVIGDPYRLTQIIINLVNNAIKFTAEGSIKISVFIEFEEDQVHLKFSIKDTGIGIAKDLQSTIFEVYTQAQDSYGRMYGGTGLGLSIVKKLVEAQDGTIGVLSELDKGSTFYFNLNYKKGLEKKPVVKDENSIKWNFSNYRILVIEDNHINQMIAKHLLEKCSIKMDIVDLGEKALELAKNNVYDLILLDIQLPDMSGEEITAQIRKFDDLEKSQVPIIAVTANAMKGDSAKYLESGMNGYLSKPYTANELYEQISNALNLSKNKL